MEYIFSFKFLKVAAIAAVIFVILDILWIGFIASRMYTNQLGFLGALKDGKIVFKLPVGLLVQVLISLGLSVLITMGLQIDNSLVTAIAVGAFTGFVIYFTYDFTNYSFVKDWPLSVSIIDVAWGTLQGLMAGGYTYWLWNKLG